MQLQLTVRKKTTSRRSFPIAPPQLPRPSGSSESPVVMFVNGNIKNLTANKKK